MIVWIASYPKSGNTWIRSLLSAYLYTKDGIFNDFDLLKKIHQFPSKKYLEFFLKKFQDIKEVSEYWIAAQDRINLLNTGTTFLKTHSALCTLENNSFTNRNNTCAAIYVVRDPRNLITSFSHHYSMNINQSYNFIIDKNKMIMQNDSDNEKGIVTILGNWSEHYKYWKNLKFAPVLIIKYEELIADTQNSLLKILNFLNRIIKIEIDEKKIINTVSSCNFEKLSNKEKKEGFSEAATYKNSKKVNFYYLGKKNNWKNMLDLEIEKKLRESFFKEMKELNYI